MPRHMLLFGFVVLVVMTSHRVEAQVATPGFSVPGLGGIRNAFPAPGLNTLRSYNNNMRHATGMPAPGQMPTFGGNIGTMGGAGFRPMGGVGGFSGSVPGMPLAGTGFGGVGLGGFGFNGAMNAGMPPGFGAGGALPYLNLLRGGDPSLNYMSLVAPQLLQNRRAQQQQVGLQQLQMQFQQQQQQLPLLLQASQQQTGQENVAQTGAGTHTYFMQRKTVEQGIQPTFMRTSGHFPGNPY